MKQRGLINDLKDSKSALAELGPETISKIPKSVKKMTRSDEDLSHETAKYYDRLFDLEQADYQPGGWHKHVGVKDDLKGVPRMEIREMADKAKRKADDSFRSEPKNVGANLGYLAGLSILPSAIIGSGLGAVGYGGYKEYNALKNDKKKKPDPSIYEKAKQSIGLGTNSEN